ncbi:hypothetical protein [Streptomyces shaanxiensis]
MTTTVPAVSEDTNLDAACTAVTAEVARTDGKASLLLAFDGAVLAGLATGADTNLPAVTKTVGAMAVLALAAAAALLLFVVRPQLGGADRASFRYWADMDDDTIRASCAATPTSCTSAPSSPLSTSPAPTTAPPTPVARAARGRSPAPPTCSSTTSTHCHCPCPAAAPSDPGASHCRCSSRS